MEVNGLTSEEAKERLAQYGPNEIRRRKDIPYFKILLSQFTSPIVLLLIGAAIVSYAIGFFPGQESEFIDTALIIFIVLVSGISGFIQEYKAEQAVEMLREMATPKAKVFRDGHEREIAATEIVPGDLILIEEGDVVPADAELVETFNIEVDESAFTGESHTAKKKEAEEIFMNTFVGTGSAKAVVTQTGMNTKIGKIASGLEEIEKETPSFQKEIGKLTRRIIFITLGIIVIMVAIGFSKFGIYHSLLLAISLAVAAIPEGLPAIVTLTLALGARKMAGQNALIRKLAVTESLGSVNIICTDKTGTLTKNEMTVRKLFYDNKVVDAQAADPREMELLVKCGTICNNSTIGRDQQNNKIYLGDQTEIALRKFAEQFEMTKEKITEVIKVIDEFPFNSQRKMMSKVVREGHEFMVFSKGAPEILIEKCQSIRENGEVRAFRENEKDKILQQNQRFADEALRVLGFAYKRFKENAHDQENVEGDLVWLGLQAMKDPPREQVRQAIKDCHTAGIRVIIITGDNANTAKAIAREIGLETTDSITGSELDQMSDEELETRLNEGCNIFSRTTPFHKQKVLKVLQKKQLVAMTGDGVNDALALKNADIGIAMGIKGTEVAKEASDMILLDDNFATIISAVKRGRTIFENIRKFINYLFTCNFAEVGILFFSTLLLTTGEPILSPVHILWVNLLTDGLPALALGVDPPRKGIMLNPPRTKGEPILNKQVMALTVAIGIKLTVILLMIFYYLLPSGFGVARTTLFTGLIVLEFVRIASIRYREKLSFFSNKWLVISLVVSLLLQLAIIYTPVNTFFDLQPLRYIEWLLLLGGAAISMILAILIINLVERLFPNNQQQRRFHPKQA